MKDMDKIFKEKLYHHTVSVSDDLWDRFESKAFTKEESENKKWIIWIFALLLILLIGSGVYIFNKNRISKSAGQSVLPIIEQSKVAGSALAETSIEKDQVSRDNSTQIGNNEKLTDNNNKAQNSNTILNKAPESKIEPQKNQIDGSLIITKETSRTVALIAPIKKPNTTFEASNLISNTGRSFQNLIISKRLSSLPLYFDLVKPEISKSSLPSITDCTNLERIPPRVFLGVYAGPDIALKYLNTKDSELMDKYKNQRIDSEVPQLSFSGGLRASWISYSGLGVKTGLDYSQINERFDYVDPNSTISKTFITIDTIFHPDGTFNTHTDTSTIIIKGRTLYSINNKYRMINLPIQFTYELTYDKNAFSLNAGVEVNLLFAQKGQMLDDNLAPRIFTTGEENSYRPFKDNIGFSYIASLAWYYDINDHLQTVVEPHFKMNGMSITNKDYPIAQKYLSSGLRIGLRYKIGKKK